MRYNRFYFLMLGICTIFQSCTIQKRYHFSGYQVEFVHLKFQSKTKVGNSNGIHLFAQNREIKTYQHQPTSIIPDWKITLKKYSLLNRINPQLQKRFQAPKLTSKNTVINQDSRDVKPKPKSRNNGFILPGIFLSAFGLALLLTDLWFIGFFLLAIDFILLIVYLIKKYKKQFNYLALLSLIFEVLGFISMTLDGPWVFILCFLLSLLFALLALLKKKRNPKETKATWIALLAVIPILVITFFSILIILAYPRY